MSYKDQYDRWRVHDLIGPASLAAVDLSSSLQDIHQRQSQWTQRLEEMQQEVNQWPADQREAVEKRCDVRDIHDKTQKVTADEGLVQDLRQWLWARAYAGSDNPASIDQAIIDAQGRKSAAGTAAATPGRAASVGSDANAVAGPSRTRSATPDPHHGASRASGSRAADEPNMTMPAAEESDRGDLVSPAIAEHRKALENSKMRSCRPCRESTVYMRKTRQADSQGLYCIKTSLPVSSTFKLDDPLAPHKSLIPSDPASLPEQLLVTVFVHPIVNRIYSKPRSERIPIVARAQRIVLLASQTLDDLRGALVSSAGTIPTEEPSAEEDHGRSMMDEDEEEEADVDFTEQRVKYTNTPWKSKCVIGIGDRLYADSDSTDSSAYINMIMDLVRQHGHSRPTQETRLVTSASQLDEDDALRFLQDDEQHQNASNMLDNDTDASPDIQTGYGISGLHAGGGSGGHQSPDSDDTDPLQQQSNEDESRKEPPKRELRYQPSGMSLKDTSFQDIIGGIRLREPCFLLQQGLDERVFEFEDIRLLHPSDPEPKFDGKDVYPITTFLSKLPATKCNVCDRDPATRITLHDELAGMSPCYICDYCFKCFHEDEEGARENGVEIIPFLG